MTNKIVQCESWSPGGAGWGYCDKNLNGGRPSYGVCMGCEHCISVSVSAPTMSEKPERRPHIDPAPRLSRGLGDTIAKATKAIGITPCGGCKQRQAALNKLIPYKDSK